MNRRSKKLRPSTSASETDDNDNDAECSAYASCSDEEAENLTMVDSNVCFQYNAKYIVIQFSKNSYHTQLYARMVTRAQRIPKYFISYFNSNNSYLRDTKNW